MNRKPNSLYSVQVKCKVCGEGRWVKPQDASLVERCKTHQRARTLQLRRERAAKGRVERTKKLKAWRSQVQVLARKNRLNNNQTKNVIVFFEQLVGQVASKSIQTRSAH